MAKPHSTTQSVLPAPRFAFVICQVGAESACKRELARQEPSWKPAFSRPGFLTFKLDSASPTAQEPLASTFARTWGWSLERITGQDGIVMARRVAELAAALQPTALHVWQRDAALPGDHGFEPFETPLSREVGELIASHLAGQESVRPRLNRIARSREVVLDVALVEPQEWWVGWHLVQTTAQRWPGGVPPQVRPAQVISRAYYKMAELLAWGRFPLRPGDLCLDLGGAPGGATQRLLEMGAKVLSVDPATMDAALMAERHVRHLRMRSREVPRRKLAGIRWLFADLNVAPKYTLDAVQDLVTSRHAHFYGVGLTLKLTDWELADHLDQYRQRVKEWGFDVVKSRQLAFNRQEFSLVGLRNKFQTRLHRRVPRAPKQTKNGGP